jgi:hypothetical protein
MTIQQATSSFVLSQSGTPLSIPNTANVSSGTITACYTPSAALPGSYSVVVEGVSLANGGAVTVLDSFSGTGASGSRSISISSYFDFFRATATWSGSSPQASVSCTFVGSGPGAGWNPAQSLTNIHTQ